MLQAKVTLVLGKQPGHPNLGCKVFQSDSSGELAGIWAVLIESFGE
jgi:hypothetical protein